MRQFLLFQLYGPLSAWGDVAVGEERPSATHPGRSAILGLLAAAKGIRRHEEEKHLAMENGYGLAVLMESPGIFLRDYHTTQVPPQVALKKHPAVTRRDEMMALSLYQKENPKASGTMLSSRAYRCDAVCRIAIWERTDAPFTVHDLASCLAYPQFVLYLGRKSCPLALPLQPQAVAAETLTDAFEKADFVSLNSFIEKSGLQTSSAEKTVSLFWDDDVESGIPPRETYIRRDKLLSRNRWQFEERRENHATWKLQGD